MTRRLIIFIIAALTWGCAPPPAPPLELPEARTAVARAYAAGADQLAPEEYRAASAALQEAEAQVRSGHYESARQTLPLAIDRARQAIDRSREIRGELERQRREAQEQAAAAAAPQPPVIEPPTAPPPPPPKAKPAPPPAPPKSYTVVNGETLWTIAARREIYADALLWPLIYKANRDQIKDPRQIFPGQTLVVPRGVSRQEEDEARETARESDIFPVEQLLESPSSEAN